MSRLQFSLVIYFDQCALATDDKIITTALSNQFSMHLCIEHKLGWSIINSSNLYYKSQHYSSQKPLRHYSLRQIVVIIIIRWNLKKKKIKQLKKIYQDFSGVKQLLYRISHSRNFWEAYLLSTPKCIHIKTNYHKNLMKISTILKFSNSLANLSINREEKKRKIMLVSWYMIIEGDVDEWRLRPLR